MLQKLYKLITLSVFVPFSLLGDSSQLGSFQRDGSSLNLISGSKVNDMPYGYFIPQFGKSSIKAFSGQDFSQYEDKKLFIGYGTYDVKEENCRYLDVPENASLPIGFDKILSTSNNTYAISRDKMTYSQCLSKAGNYSGFVYAPRDANEASMVFRNFGLEKDIWIGYTKSSCAETYKNDESFKQSYENFLYPAEICNDFNRFTSKLSDELYWTREDQGSLHYCPIRIASMDYLRPIKFCLPWWRVERQWKLSENDDRFEYNGQSFDFSYAQYLMDYPQEKTICTQISTNEFPLDKNFKSTIKIESTNDLNQTIFIDKTVSCTATNPSLISEYQFSVDFNANCIASNDSTFYNHTDINFICKNTDADNLLSTATCYQEAPSFEVTCAAYDDMTKSNICINNISEAVCHVDECRGYIKDVCRKTGTVSQFKDYDIGYIISDNVEKKVKIKQNKTLSSYSCPPPNKSNDKCLTKSVVSVFPFWCPNPTTGLPSQCKELSVCLQDKTKTKDECLGAYYCEKSYGSVDHIIYNDGGDAVALGGVCKDGITEVNATISIKDKETKTCTAYEDFNQTTELYKSCISTSTSTNATVSTSITEQDIYKDNENCIRTNNIEEARPTVQTVFEYETKGFFKTAIQKAYIDNTDETHESNASNEYLLTAATLRLEPYTSSKSEPVAVEDDGVQSFCDATFSSEWNNRLISTDTSDDDAATTQPYPSIMGFLHQSNSGVLEKCRPNGTLANNRCEYNTPACGLFTYQSSDDTCRDSSQNIKPFNCSDYASRTGNICYEDKWYNYPLIAVSSSLSTCDAYKTGMGFAVNTKGNVFFNDYDFATLGITQTQINNKQFCILGGDMIQGDEIFKAIKINGEDSYYTSKNSVDESLCSKYARCVTGDITTSYSGGNAICQIHSNQTTGQIPETPVNLPSPTLSTIPFEETRGTFVGDINGYTDIFAVQEYTEGNFGYASNYAFKLPRNNLVMIDNKEISPIIDQTSIQYPLKYDYMQSQNTQITKNKSPTNTDSGASGLSYIGTYIGDNRVFGSTFLSNWQEIGLSPLMIFAGTQKWGWYNSDYNMYQTLTANDKYVPNLYGYDPRIFENGVLVWDRQSVQSGTMKSGNYSAFRNQIIEDKKDKFLFMGFNEDYMNTYMISSNEKNAIGWPGIRWYKPSAKKTNSSSTGNQSTNIQKPINTVFMGAVNSLSIVVPYKGEYEVRAFDKNNNLLGTKLVQEQNFIKGVPSSYGNVAQTFAKVQMATANDYNVAPGQDKELLNGSCISSNFVEWGGGVSGAYYEKGVPDIGMGSDCKKSNDNYVKEHSAVRITINAKNSPIIFNVRLKKPMPYPNRIVLTTLDQLETRKYECWTDTVPCDVNTATEMEK